MPMIEQPTLSELRLAAIEMSPPSFAVKMRLMAGIGDKNKIDEAINAFDGIIAEFIK